MEVEFEEGVGFRREVGDAALHRLMDNWVGVRGRDDRRGGPLDDVLVDAEGFVELPERLFEPVCDGLAFRVIEVLVIDALQAEDEPESAGLRQKGRVIDEAPQCEEPIEAPGRHWRGFGKLGSCRATVIGTKSAVA